MAQTFGEAEFKLRVNDSALTKGFLKATAASEKATATITKNLDKIKSSSTDAASGLTILEKAGAATGLSFLNQAKSVAELSQALALLTAAQAAAIGKSAVLTAKNFALAASNIAVKVSMIGVGDAVRVATAAIGTFAKAIAPLLGRLVVLAATVWAVLDAYKAIKSFLVDLGIFKKQLTDKEKKAIEEVQQKERQERTDTHNKILELARKRDVLLGKRSRFEGEDPNIVKLTKQIETIERGQKQDDINAALEREVIILNEIAEGRSRERAELDFVLDARQHELETIILIRKEDEERLKLAKEQAKQQAQALKQNERFRKAQRDFVEKASGLGGLRSRLQGELQKRSQDAEIKRLLANVPGGAAVAQQFLTTPGKGLAPTSAIDTSALQGLKGGLIGVEQGDKKPASSKDIKGVIEAIDKGVKDKLDAMLLFMRMQTGIGLGDLVT